MKCSEDVLQAADRLIQLALDEDLSTMGDLTSRATVPDKTASVHVVSRECGVAAGICLIERVYQALSQRMGLAEDTVRVTCHLDDGTPVSSQSRLATITGPIALLLSGERTALNFLIHLSGIASMTHQFVEKIRGSRAVILDTRKTLPGYRHLQKFAVRCGGGQNHRMGLYDGILIKDNHLAARDASSVAEAVQAARTFLQEQGLTVPVEVEVDSLEQLADVLTIHPEIVLLDNMSPAELRQAVTMRDLTSPDTLLEASGGITLETVGCVAGTGVDRISIGGLTHSAPALDIGFDWQWSAPDDATQQVAGIGRPSR